MRRILIFLTMVALGFFSIALNVFPSNNLSASFHGVLVADTEVIADNYDDAIIGLDSTLRVRAELPINLNIDGSSYQFVASDLGVDFDTYKTAERVYDANKRSGILKRLRKVSVEPVVDVDTNTLYSALSLYLTDLGGPTDATVEVTPSGLFVSKHSDGRSIDDSKVVKDIVASLLQDVPVQVKVETKVLPAEYTEEQARIDASLMSNIYREPLRLVYSDDIETKSVELNLNSDYVYVRNSEYIFDEALLKKYITNNVSSEFDIKRQDAIIKALPAQENLSAEVEGLAIDGRMIDMDESLNSLKAAVSSGKHTVILKVINEDALIVNQTGVDLGEMKLLAVGRSNFAGSSAGRVKNVEYGLNEKFNNVLLSPNGEFSAIDNSGKEISVRNGWSMAKVIQGGKIVDGVGGGLCQCSTTMYRAALNAGMDILFRQQHTVYVSYYSEYGDGLDAAIFNANGLDFKFKNTSPSYVLIQSYVEGDDAFVKFYGTDDGRKVEMMGPFYGQHNSSPHKLLPGLKYNQIGWVRKITFLDGRVTEEPIVSSYKGMPKK